MTRVVVTGLGPVSSIGIGREAFTAGLRAGRCGAAPITAFDTTGFPYVHGCEVTAFEPERIIRRLDVAAWGRSSLFAAAAARLAMDDAGLDPAASDPDRVVTVVGTTSGESQVVENVTRSIVDGGFEAIGPADARRLPAGRLARAVSTELGLTGEAMTMATACSASNYALGYAYDLLMTGEADVAVAGGADSVCRWAHAGFYRLGALTENRCTPFERNRTGILTGEGGSALVLETEEHARARGARVHAEMRGYGLNCDARHMVAPDAESIAACMRMAHHYAGVVPDDIDYICAHGTGTRANDAVEVQAIMKTFGTRLPPVSSIKSMIGHTMGAASGFGAIASVLAIVEGFLPPTINWTEPDPELGGIEPVPGRARAATVRMVQNNGFAFGGNNAITIFGAAS